MTWFAPILYFGGHLTIYQYVLVLREGTVKRYCEPSYSCLMSPQLLLFLPVRLLLSVEEKQGYHTATVLDLQESQKRKEK